MLAYDAGRTFVGDLWTWDGARWTALRVPGNEAPGPRASATLLPDAAGGRMLYHGGTVPGGRLPGELWVLDAAGWRPAGR